MHQQADTIGAVDTVAIASVRQRRHTCRNIPCQALHALAPRPIDTAEAHRRAQRSQGQLLLRRQQYPPVETGRPRRRLFIHPATVLPVHGRAGDKDDRRQRLLPAQRIKQPQRGREEGPGVAGLIAARRGHDDIKQIHRVRRQADNILAQVLRVQVHPFRASRLPANTAHPVPGGAHPAGQLAAQVTEPCNQNMCHGAPRLLSWPRPAHVQPDARSMLFGLCCPSRVVQAVLSKLCRPNCVAQRTVVRPAGHASKDLPLSLGGPIKYSLSIVITDYQRRQRKPP